MLSPEITIYDVAYILTLAVYGLSILVAYHVGRRNGFIEGSRVRRKVLREAKHGLAYDILNDSKVKEVQYGATRRRRVRMGRRHRYQSAYR